MEDGRAANNDSKKSLLSCSRIYVQCMEWIELNYSIDDIHEVYYQKTVVIAKKLVVLFQGIQRMEWIEFIIPEMIFTKFLNIRRLPLHVWTPVAALVSPNPMHYHSYKRMLRESRDFRKYWAAATTACHICPSYIKLGTISVDCLFFHRVAALVPAFRDSIGAHAPTCISIYSNFLCIFWPKR